VGKRDDIYSMIDKINNLTDENYFIDSYLIDNGKTKYFTVTKKGKEWIRTSEKIHYKKTKVFLEGILFCLLDS